MGINFERICLAAYQRGSTAVFIGGLGVDDFDHCPLVNSFDVAHCPSRHDGGLVITSSAGHSTEANMPRILWHPIVKQKHVTTSWHATDAGE